MIEIVKDWNEFADKRSFFEIRSEPKPMNLILTAEYPLLYEMLKRNALIHGDQNARQALLHACGFPTLIDSFQPGNPAATFTNILITKLEIMKESGKPPLIRFLERYATVYEKDVDEEDKALIQGVINRWENGQRPTGTASGESADPEVPFRLDKAVMFGFDLEELIGDFRKQLEEVEGIFGFSVGNKDTSMMENYIKHRLIQGYKQKIKEGEQNIHHKKYEIKDLYMHPAEANGGAEVLQQKIRKQLDCSAREWFQNPNNERKDLVVCILNNHIPSKDMKRMAFYYMKYALKNLAPILRLQRMIIIWFSPEPIQIKGKVFTVLNLPSPVPAPWLGWFRDIFVTMKLDNNAIESYMRNLEEQEGVLDCIYREFCSIMERLQRGEVAQ